LCPEILLILVTTAPHWLLESYIQGDFIYRPRWCGVVQADSLKMDKLATLERLQQIHSAAIARCRGSQLYPPKPWVNPGRYSSLAAVIANQRAFCWMSSNWLGLYLPSLGR